MLGEGLPADGLTDVAVDVADVSRIYRTRSHEGAFFRQLLRPTFIEHVAVDNVSFQIRAGQCLGLVGPNGAGKSTMIKLLTGLLKPSSGRISVLGFEPGKLSPQLLTKIAAVFGHKTSLWWDLPVRQSFDAMQKIYQVRAETFNQDVERFSALLNINGLMNRTVRQLSLGERIKCELVMALAHRPRVLLLDEPTIGVDMESKNQLRMLINQIVSERNVAVLLTTHDVNDLVTCCTHIAFIQAGHVFQLETMEGVLQMFGVSRDNSRALESCLIETFRSRGGASNADIEFGSTVLDEAAEDDD